MTPRAPRGPAAGGAPRLPLLAAVPTIAVLALVLVAGASVLLVPARSAAPPPAPAPAPTGATVQAAAGAPRVVVVGAAGLRWDDVGPHTPALQRVAGTGAVGVLSVKALPDASCPADGWLTLGAGARAQAFSAEREPCGSAVRVDAADPERNIRSRDGARLAALASALGGGVTATGPGALLATGGRSLPAAPVHVVDAGQVAGSDRPAGARGVDAVVADVLARLPPDTDLLVVGLSEGPGDDTAHLHVALATGPRWPSGALRSASTRQAPYVQLVDVAPTVLAALGRPVPPEMDGQPWTVAGSAPGVAALADLDRQAVAGKRITVPFFVALAAVQVGALVLVRRRPAAVRLVGLAGVLALGASYAAMLVPWWRAPLPLLALGGVAAALAVPTAALLVRRRSAVGLACLLVAGLLVADLVTGSHLQMASPAGYSPLVAGRFSGLGNVAFGVYAAAALLATASLAAGRSRRQTAGLVALAGVLFVAVAGAPQWGSDVGGVLALLPAYVVLGLRLTGARLSPARLALAGLAAAGLVTAFALFDLARPAAQRSHLGRFAQQVADGTAGEVLQRKATAVLALLFANPVTALLPLAVAAAVLAVRRPPAPLRRAFAQVPAYRSALTAVGVAGGIGFAVNDSGAAVPALALAVVLPATVAVVAGVPQRPGDPPHG